MSDGINGALLEDLIIYELSLINVENEFLPTKIYGSQKGYCINSECKIKDLRCKLIFLMIEIKCYFYNNNIKIIHDINLY